MDERIAYAGCLLDRAAHLRGNAAWLSERLADPGSRVLPVWRDMSLLSGGERPRLAALQARPAAEALALADEPLFLGLGEDGHAWFACDLSGCEEAAFRGLLNGADFRDLGRVVTVLARSDAALLAYVRALAHWRRRHRFCGACGSPTEPRQGGHLRLCSNSDCLAEHFPRTDPVVIMLVTRAGDDGQGECLLARQRHWMPGLVSVLAGFVEPGETLEEAVRREVYEETGLALAQVSYQASQPWPFPASLMVGFRAQAIEGAPLCFDREELEDARWFRREEVASIRSMGLRLPHRGTIARALIEGWLGSAQAEPG
jgi:NAD+ diphosphatase